MNILAEKIELTKLLLDIDNPSIISLIKNILKKESAKDFWNELSIEQKQEIEEASQEIENGDVVNYEKFMSKHR